MKLELPPCTLRSWRAGDAQALAHHANSRKIWRNLRDRFPHPYVLADAQAWLRSLEGVVPETSFAIEVASEACGGISLHLRDDVARRSAELGFWLGEAHWGRGIMSAAVAAITEYGFRTLQCLRVYAMVFEWNVASMRVLEKCGYAREGVLRRSAVKDGQVIDMMLYASVR